jgi:hypothetical protein
MSTTTRSKTGPPAAAGPESRPWRTVAFVAVTIVCLAGAGIAIFRGNPSPADGPGNVNGPPIATVPLAELNNRPHLLFRNTRRGDDFGRLSLAALDAPDSPLAFTDLHCERVDFAADRGLCLTATRGAVTTYGAVVFDQNFNPRFTSSIPGLPSRVRVSPDGHYGSTTMFVYGDSYAGNNFSTRTLLMDLRTGEQIADVEQFGVILGGERHESVDFNFWGVTFARDPNTFYATLGTGGHTYLVRGDIARREVTVLRDGVECPMLSPDNRRIAFKSKRIDSQFGRVEWRLSVLDLDTLTDHPLAETRSVDDQAQWIDNATVQYAIPSGPGSPTFDTWAVPADGTGTPRLVLAGAVSASADTP